VAAGLAATGLTALGGAAVAAAGLNFAADETDDGDEHRNHRHEFTSHYEILLN
jgi:hypothetical protein